jgi:hypothetical protein
LPPPPPPPPAFAASGAALEPARRRLDVKKRYSEEQIVGFLREAEAGAPVKNLCRKRRSAMSIGCRL